MTIDQKPFQVIAEGVVDLEMAEATNIINELDGTYDPCLLAFRGVLGLYVGPNSVGKVTLYDREQELGHYYLCLAFAQAEEGNFTIALQSYDYSRQLSPNDFSREIPG